MSAPRRPKPAAPATKKAPPAAVPAARPDLVKLAAAYQATAVIPHCTRCTRPCCKLDALVLDLEWRQVKTLWRIEEARQDFDRRLRAGQGPSEIREAHGRYYVHTKPCPAYDQDAGTCRVYGQDVKPAGCSDFPVYEDEGEIMADLRCEAVTLDALSEYLRHAAGPAYRLQQRADPDFPFLVTLALKKTGPRRR